MSPEEDVDAVKAVDAVAGGQDPLVGQQGTAAEVGVGALLHEQAGHPGVLVRRRLASPGDAGVGSSHTAFTYY